MSKKTLAVRVDSQVAERLRRYCVERGLKQGFFVEKALREQIERDELSEGLREGRAQEAPAVSLKDRGFWVYRTGRPLKGLSIPGWIDASRAERDRQAGG